MDLIEVRLTSVRYAARDTNLYEFQERHGSELPAALPGAHVDVHLPNGIIRQYSLTNPQPAPRAYVIAVKRDSASSGGSKYIFDHLKVGALIKIGRPRNNFPLVESATTSVLIAGGIGITPIWAMVQRLQTLCRPWELHYACRSREDAAFLSHLDALPGVRLHFDEENAGKFLDVSAVIAAAPRDAHFYCCGPIPMLKAFEGATKNLLPERVHVEYFAPKEAPNLDGGFIVELRRSRREFVIPPGRSILDVLRSAGLLVPHSCEQGICGTCETVVISGIPDHRDSVLTEREHASNRTMMICCSGSKSERLVLDL
jgi:tetrachlorobenzoquinone reductase